MTKDLSQDYFESNRQLQDRPAMRWYARVCRRLLGRDVCDVFEFGCGLGWLLRHLAGYHRVSGYDASEFCRAKTAEHAPGATVYPTLDDVPHGAFDLVVALHVLEHVPEPAATITRLAALLRPGGKLLFVVPADNGLGHRLKKDKWFAYRDSTHISLLPETRWRQHVLAANLRIIAEAGDGLWDPPYVSWLPRLVQLPLFGAPAAVQVYVGRGRLFVPARWSECLILVAQKPAPTDVRR